MRETCQGRRRWLGPRCTKDARKRPGLAHGSVGDPEEACAPRGSDQVLYPHGHEEVTGNGVCRSLISQPCMGWCRSAAGSARLVYWDGVSHQQGNRGLAYQMADRGLDMQQGAGLHERVGRCR